MLRFVKNKIFIVILITVILLVAIGVSASKNSKLNWLNNIISVPLSPVQSLISSIGQKTSDVFALFNDTNAIRLENEKLKVKVNELEKQNRELSSYKDKNVELRQALSLKEQYENYSILGANIIAIDPSNWFNVFAIDTGEKDGIKVDDPVVTSSKGLVGRVLSSELTSAKILTIIDEDSAVAAWISKSGGGYARVRGDIQLKERGYCRLDYIPIDVDVEVGDVVETSGLGGIYPKGITIGRVIEVKKTDNEINRYAIIEPAADFKKLQEVYVLKSKTNNNVSGSVGK